MMPDIKESDINKYVTIFNPIIKLPDLMDIIVLINYFLKSNNYYVINRICKLLMLTEESDYWTSKTHIIPNFNAEFNKRSFRKITPTTENKKTEVNKNIDYINFKMKKEEKPETIAINKASELKYYIDKEKPELTKEVLNEIFKNMTSNKLKYYLFNILLISKKYCHLVVNNSEILKIMKDIINDNLILYRYLFGYVWFCFYLEENIMKTKTKITNRYVFDIETASNLPNFPFTNLRLSYSPYLPQFYSTEYHAKNFIGYKTLSTQTNYNFNIHKSYRIPSLELFKNSFKLFTSGSLDIDIFEGLKWSNYAISGSVMPACIFGSNFIITCVNAIKNIVEELSRGDKVNFTLNEKEILQINFNEHYKDADIDMMCNKECVFEYLDSVNEITETIKQNILKKNPEENVNFEINPKKTSSMIIHSKYLKEKLKDINTFAGKEMSLEEIEKSLDDPLIRGYLYMKYYELKFERIKEDRKKYNKSDYDIYYKFSSPDEIKYYLYNKENNYQFGENDIVYYMSDLKKEIIPKELNYPLLKINETIKIQIKCNKLPHPIELFRATRNNDFFSMVSKFHLPCVRSFYNGDNVYMLPSAISAYMTGINLDYKIFMTMKDPCDILLKYYTRGFGMVLSNSEKESIKKYLETSEKWKDKITIEQLDGARPFIDKANTKFKNVKTEFEYIDSISDMENEYIYLTNLKDSIILKNNPLENKTRIQDLKHEFAEKNSLNPFALYTIDSSGNSLPLKKWIIDALYSE